MDLCQRCVLQVKLRGLRLWQAVWGNRHVASVNPSLREIGVHYPGLAATCQPGIWRSPQVQSNCTMLVCEGQI